VHREGSNTIKPEQDSVGDVPSPSEKKQLEGHILITACEQTNALHDSIATPCLERVELVAPLMLGAHYHPTDHRRYPSKREE